MTSPADRSPDLTALFADLDRIQSQVSLVRRDRPRTEAFFEVHERRSLHYQRVLRALLATLTRNDRMMEMIRSASPADVKARELKNALADVLPAVSSSLGVTLTEREQGTAVLDSIDEVLGLGPIEQLMRDREISEIMVNGPDFIFVERRGQIELTPLKFQDVEHMMKTVDKILSPIGRRVNESSPYVDARLADGSRVNVAVPPVALNGPLITIRKFPETMLTIDDLIRSEAMTPAMARFLMLAVEGQLNILVSGGTGSGKTTILNILSTCLPPGERIVTIEDSAELQLHRSHINVARLEARQPNSDGKGEITIRNLLRNSLRMRPDRIVIGEVRGGEAFEMLQAMNTGHDGSLSTAHANSPAEMIHRLEGMCLSAGLDLPISVIRQMVAGSLHLIIQMSRLKDGSRRMVEITELDGIENGDVRLHPLWSFRSQGMGSDGRIRGVFERSPRRPKCLEKIAASGAEVPEDF
jgi:pilus assembly protein CpaF